MMGGAIELIGAGFEIELVIRLYHGVMKWLCNRTFGVVPFFGEEGVLRD